ncbi:MAG: hypothetical protein NVSMB18_00430 [Acetobacteraceae bacterium]
MNMSQGFIRRPIATSLLIVAVVALGIIAYRQLGLAALPNVNLPTIQVSAQLPGADPATTASAVATPLERQFGQIPGLTQMSSGSGNGLVQITLQFDSSRSIDSAATDVQAAINAASARLPASLLSLPTYRKTNPADTPILQLGLSSDTLPITTVSDYANSILAQKISQLPGVGLVGVGGLQSPSIHVQLNPAQLAAENLDLEEVRTALTNATVNQPKGQIYGAQQAFQLQTNDQLMTAAGFEDVILAYRNGAPIRVRDVGRAVVGPEDPTQAAWLNDKRAVLLSVQRQPSANVVSTVDAITKALPTLQASLPPSIKVEVVSDRTQTIRASVADVQFTLLLTIGLVVAVIAVFLRRLWATVIPAVSVPISLVGTFGVMFALGYTLDNLSLMALTIAVGFVVDDAIVMVENIVRHIEAGKTPMQAALEGAGEIGFTILSISISLGAVFIPLFLMSGLVGLLFREFAVTVAVSILVSAFVSLTLTPMMAARLLTAEKRPGRISAAMERGFDGMLELYDRGLVLALRHRLITLGVMLLTVAATVALFVVIPKGFFPQQDTGLIGAGGVTVTGNNGRVFLTLKPSSQRNVTADQVIARLNTAMQQVQGIKLYMQAAQDITIDRAAASLRHRPGADRQHALRRVRPPPRRQVVYGAQPILRHHGGGAVLPARSGGAAPALPPLAGRDRDPARADCGRQAGAGAARDQPSGAVPVGDAELQPGPRDGDRPGGERGAAGGREPAATGLARRQLPGQCAGGPELARQHAAADPGGAVRGLRHPGHAVRERDPPADDPVDLALGRGGGAGDADAVRAAAGRDRHHRHHPADRHRQEERHHDGGLRAACGA